MRVSVFMFLERKRLFNRMKCTTTTRTECTSFKNRLNVTDSTVSLTHIQPFKHCRTLTVAVRSEMQCRSCRGCPTSITHPTPNQQAPLTRLPQTRTSSLSITHNFASTPSSTTKVDLRLRINVHLTFEVIYCRRRCVLFLLRPRYVAWQRRS